MAPEVSFTPAEPVAGDGVLVTVKGEVAEGATVIITSEGDQLAKSAPFGQGEIPEGTGPEARSLQITGGSSGTFILTVTDPDTADEIETDPIYYYNDGPPNYAYPDDAVVQAALEDILPDDVPVTVTKSGALMTILFGGKWSGKNIPMAVNSAAIGGSETATAADVEAVGGPFVFGPTFLQEGSYEIDVIDEDGDSILGATVELEVAE